MPSKRLLVSLETPNRVKRFLVRLPLTLQTAEWVARAFLEDTAKHALHAQIPPARFKAHVISTQGTRWHLTFSRSKTPMCYEVRGRPVAVVKSDRAALEVYLEEVEEQVLDMAEVTRSLKAPGEPQCVVTRPTKSPRSMQAS